MRSALSAALLLVAGAQQAHSYGVGDLEMKPNIKETKMKKIILALAALSALSTASFAERKWDLRDSPESQGSFSTPTDRAANDVFANDTAPLAGVGVKADVQVKRTQAIDELYDAHGFRR